MRKGFVILVFLYACNSEPKGVVYEFKMINTTDSDYVIKKHYRYSNAIVKTDTLFARSEMSFSVPRVGSYGQSFGDSLINSFFDTFIVKSINTNEQINVGNRSSWEERSEFDEDFLEKSGSVKGKVIYTFKIES